VILADANKIDALDKKRLTLHTISVHKIEEEEHIPAPSKKRPLYIAASSARARQQEASKKRPLDTISVEDQERIKRLKAIEARSQKK